MENTSLEKENKSIVENLYKSLAKGNSQSVANHLASDLEWWFHGPPQCQHMMRVLTGELARPEFWFKPRSVTAIEGGVRVIAEGWEGAHAYWVHVWTLNNDGLITQFREYFNTCLTVRDLRPNGWEIKRASPNERPTVWQSHQPNMSAGQSMPGLVLAI